MVRCLSDVIDDFAKGQEDMMEQEKTNAKDQAVIKRSVRLKGHRTSVSLETIFWDELKSIAQGRNVSLSKMIGEIDEKRQSNLSSALRVFVLKNVKSS